MIKAYSKSKKGFYFVESIENDDLIDVTNIYDELIRMQSEGKTIMQPDGEHDVPWLKEPEPVNPAIAEVAELKVYLSSTDYVVIKLGESGLSKADFLSQKDNGKYKEIFDRRAVARARIDELEQALAHSKHSSFRA